MKYRFEEKKSKNCCPTKRRKYGQKNVIQMHQKKFGTSKILYMSNCIHMTGTFRNLWRYPETQENNSSLENCAILPSLLAVTV